MPLSCHEFAFSLSLGSVYLCLPLCLIALPLSSGLVLLCCASLSFTYLCRVVFVLHLSCFCLCRVVFVALSLLRLVFSFVYILYSCRSLIPGLVFRLFLALSYLSSSLPSSLHTPFSSSCVGLCCLVTVLYCAELSCLVWSGLGLFRLALPCLVLPCLALSCLVLSCLVLSGVALSCIDLPCFVLCAVLSLSLSLPKIVVRQLPHDLTEDEVPFCFDIVIDFCLPSKLKFGNNVRLG